MNNIQQFLEDKLNELDIIENERNFEPGTYTLNNAQLAYIVSEQRNTVLEEERQFILNILAGIDIADKEMGVIGGTQAIRQALQSRINNYETNQQPKRRINIPSN